jgi:hypothetical protein
MELAGDRAGAEQEHLARWSYFVDAGDHGRLFAIQSAYDLAFFYCDDDRWDDAERVAASVRDVPLTGRNAFDYLVSRLAVEARLAAREGRLAEAVALGEEAVASAETLEGMNAKEHAWLALAEVHRAAGHLAETDVATARAIELYEGKGNIAASARIRAVASSG